MIKIRDFTFDINSELKIELQYRDRLINKKYVECISKSTTHQDFYRVDLSNNQGYYQGYIIDSKNKIVKDINKIKNMVK